MFDIVGKRSLFFLISEVVILIGIIALVVFGLQPGIEFSSGSIMTVSFAQEVDQDELKQELIDLGHTNVIIQHTEEGDFIIRTSELTEEDKTALESALAERFGFAAERRFYSVSPMVAEDLYPEHDLFIQLIKLKNTLRHMMGEDLITHLGLEYYE